MPLKTHGNERSILWNAFFIHDIGFEPQDGKHHQRRQHRSDKIDEGHQDSVEVAVIVSLVVAREGNDPTKSQT